MLFFDGQGSHDSTKRLVHCNDNKGAKEGEGRDYPLWDTIDILQFYLGDVDTVYDAKADSDD
jgi:hypothetical protein